MLKYKARLLSSTDNMVYVVMYNPIKTDLSAGTPHGISRIPQRFSGR